MSKKVKIVYLDDDLMNLKLFEINLRKQFDILTAINAEAAIDLLKNNPDTSVVISDLHMPETNGITFIKIAKEQFPDKKYYLLTGFDTTPQITEAITEGLIIECLYKPFNTEMLSKVIS